MSEIQKPGFIGSVIYFAPTVTPDRLYALMQIENLPTRIKRQVRGIAWKTIAGVTVEVDPVTRRIDRFVAAHTAMGLEKERQRVETDPQLRVVDRG